MHNPRRFNPGQKKHPAIRQNQPNGEISSTSTNPAGGPPMYMTLLAGIETGTPAAAGTTDTWIVLPGVTPGGQVTTMTWPSRNTWNLKGRETISRERIGGS